MPIVDGRYEMKISTTYNTPEEAIEEIKHKLKSTRKIRISGIPRKLLEELTPYLENKDLKIILPLGEKPTPEMKKLGDIATTKAKIYKEYHGKEVNTGSVQFPDVIYNFTWSENKILAADAMNYNRCVKCMNESFEGGWRYSEKH